MDVFAGLVGIAAIVAMYFLPGIIASGNRAENQVGIWVVNGLLGWTVIGWLAALIWAFVDKSPAQKQREQQQQAALLAQRMRQPPPNYPPSSSPSGGYFQPRR